jgi:hypothetical protein
MPNEFDTALRNAAASVAKYVKDAAMMQVETQYVMVGQDGSADFASAKPAARTIIRLDGDSEAVVPVRQNEAGALEVDGGLYALHQENVATAIEYRARILNSLLSTVLARRQGG